MEFLVPFGGPRKMTENRYSAAGRRYRKTRRKIDCRVCGRTPSPDIRFERFARSAFGFRLHRKMYARSYLYAYRYAAGRAKQYRGAIVPTRRRRLFAFFTR